MSSVVVTGGFDNIKSLDIRFLQEATRFGNLNVHLWTDNAITQMTGGSPKFPQRERLYFLDAIRYVDKVCLVDSVENFDVIPMVGNVLPDIWVVPESDDTHQKRTFADGNEIQYQVIHATDLSGYPDTNNSHTQTVNKKVVVTGCFDWFHSGHVRFFQETSQLGDLYVIVGHDENLRLLKGEGHPMHSQDERRYMAGSIRFVTRALVSSGSGWMDAEPEIEMLQPDIYAVNEDGDKPEKQAFCQQHGLEYVVLKRSPAAGLPRRNSTNLRGF